MKGVFGMADTEVCQRCAEISGAGELLPSVYRRVCSSGKAITQHGEKR